MHLNDPCEKMIDIYTASYSFSAHLLSLATCCHVVIFPRDNIAQKVTRPMKSQLMQEI